MKAIDLNLIPKFTQLVLVAVIAFSAARYTWILLGAIYGSDEYALVQLPSSETVPVSQERPSLMEVARLHLLGEEEKQIQAVKAPEVVQAPETRLDLILRGLVASNDQRNALALIATGKGNELPYKVGAEVPGGAVISEILADRVILRRGGRLETLKLPKDRLNPAEVQRKDSASTGDSGSQGRSVLPANVSHQIEDYRRKVIENPQRAMDLAHIEPVMNGGQLKGYKLSPSRERDLFRRVGLRSGDVVTHVNGIPVSDTSRMGELISLLSNARSLDVTLERAGQPTQLSLALGN